MMPARKRFDTIFLLIIVGILAVFCFAAEADLVIEGTFSASPPEEQNKTLATLNSIIQSTSTLQTQIQEKEQALQTAGTEEQRSKIIKELNDLTQHVETLEMDFEGIATGIDLEKFSARPRTSFDWKEEIQEVLGPIIEELKRVTARPRELEKLRSEVLYYETRLPLIQHGLNNIRLLMLNARAPQLKTQLSALERAWIEREKQVANQLAVAQYRLEEKLGEEKPLVESVQEIVRIFFKSRGRNLLLAILAFVAVMVGFRFLDRILFKLTLIRVSQKRSFYSRLANVMYHILRIVSATIAALTVLYISGDWVLLGVSLIFLFGIAWTAKQGLPLFWEQIKLLLNLSTVRENERVVYNGIPWRVASLNLYTRLHNPALKGGLIRLPLRELVELHSRPFHKDEPWFPCQEDDWVVLADGTFGKVWMQTPEMVQLILLGGSRKTYPTLEFLQQHPNNLSTNFRLELTFGIDYQHQAISTTEIPQTLQKILQQELIHEGYQDHLINLEVEFQKAGTSSLDLEIMADFSGEAARDYRELSRIIQRIAVDACNTHGWLIPFTQITLHTAQTNVAEQPQHSKAS
jgi:predicted  nucleic acid-binding Zn-ribbon protein